MKQQIEKRKGRAKIGAVLMLSGLILLTGCGLNDNPMPEMNVRTVFPVGSGDYTAMMTGPTGTDVTDFPVVSLLVGAVMITHTDMPYLDGSLINSTMQTDIEDDALRSAKYFSVALLSDIGDSLNFQMPPPSVGDKWQLFAVGLKYPGTTLSEVVEMLADAPTWFGFDSRGFLGGVVNPGDTLTIQMQRACAITSNQAKAYCQANLPPVP